MAKNMDGGAQQTAHQTTIKLAINTFNFYKLKRKYNMGSAYCWNVSVFYFRWATGLKVSGFVISGSELDEKTSSGWCAKKKRVGDRCKEATDVTRVDVESIEEKNEDARKLFGDEHDNNDADYTITKCRANRQCVTQQLRGN